MQRRWLSQLLEAAGARPNFEVSSTPVRILFENLVRERNFEPSEFLRARDEARQHRRHRADAGALVYAQLWKRIMEGAGN